MINKKAISANYLINPYPANMEKMVSP